MQYLNTMKTIEKNKLISMFLSEDIELRKLGESLLISNFNLPEKLYCVYDKYGKYYLDMYPQKGPFYFSLNKDEYLDWFERQFVSKEQKTILLSAIFKYNEEYK